MKTIHSNNDALLEGVKISEKWFNNVNSAMMEIYNKQLNLATNYYINLLNSTFGGAYNQDKTKNPFAMFFNTDPIKAFWFPFNNEGSAFSNPFINSFEKVYKELMEYNKNLLATFNSELKNNITDWNKTKLAYRDYIEDQIEISKKIVDSVAEAYDKQGEFSSQLYKEAVEKINRQISLLIKQDEELLANILSVDGNDEKDGSKKEASINDSKKKAGVSVTA